MKISCRQRFSKSIVEEIQRSLHTKLMILIIWGKKWRGNYRFWRK